MKSNPSPPPSGDLCDVGTPITFKAAYVFYADDIIKTAPVGRRYIYCLRLQYQGSALGCTGNKKGSGNPEPLS